LNHLAHFFLSFQQENLIVGNHIADDIKGNDWENYPKDIQTGILLHRNIDAFTDAHPLTLQLNQQVRPYARKYAGPVGDILRDYFLSICWQEFSEQDLPIFAKDVYTKLEKNLTTFSPTLFERTPRMIAANWLVNYGSLDGITYVLSRFQNRLRQKVDIEGLMLFIEENEAPLLDDFRIYFKEMTTFFEHYKEKTS
jgi:acyl carrier protein phosphodiesterase